MSQQNQYNQMLQQMMMNKQRPSPYSPAPYANGGNVALRRKMFKLGGSASAHGTGLTSGLAFDRMVFVVVDRPCLQHSLSFYLLDVFATYQLHLLLVI